jgi:hypothetical protein
MEKEFIPYDLAVKLKELGFDEPCLASYYTDIDENNLEGKHDYRKTFNGLEYHPLDKWGTSWEPNFIRNTESVHYMSAPTPSQAFRWFEDNHKLYPAVVIDQTSYPKYAFEIASFFGNPKCLTEQEWGWNEMILSKNLYRTRTEAEIACLEKLIEIVENKQK